MDGEAQNQDGFTLLEVLITITLAAIIALMAAPRMNELLAENRIDTTKAHLKRAAYLARTEAIMRGVGVYLCLTSDENECSGQNPSKVMVFTDPDFQGERSSDSNLLLKYSWDQRNIHVSYNRSLLKFTPRGYASGTNGTFTICSLSNSVRDGLVISTLGRARDTRDYDNDGVQDKAPGIPLVCP